LVEQIKEKIMSEKKEYDIVVIGVTSLVRTESQAKEVFGIDWPKIKEELKTQKLVQIGRFFRISEKE